MAVEEVENKTMLRERICGNLDKLGKLPREAKRGSDGLDASTGASGAPPCGRGSKMTGVKDSFGGAYLFSQTVQRRMRLGVVRYGRM